MKSKKKYVTRTAPLPESLLESLSLARKHDLPVMDAVEARRRLQRILGHLEIPGGTIHTLRHTFASHLVQRGVSLFVVQKLLGHSSIKTTEIYSHLVPENFHESVKLLPF